MKVLEHFRKNSNFKHNNLSKHIKTTLSLKIILRMLLAFINFSFLYISKRNVVFVEKSPTPLMHAQLGILYRIRVCFYVNETYQHLTQSLESYSQILQDFYYDCCFKITYYLYELTYVIVCFCLIPLQGKTSKIRILFQ
jgi:hypothetical protein